MLGSTPPAIRIGWTGRAWLSARAATSAITSSPAGGAQGEEREVLPYLRRSLGRLTLKPEHAKLSAYFNLDNGTGRVRGVYTQQNVAAVPIFEAWLRPLADLGATTITNRDTSGTDHQSFDRVGLPGFQFIQDDTEYSTVTHHTNIDVYDRLQKEDLMQHRW